MWQKFENFLDLLRTRTRTCPSINPMCPNPIAIPALSYFAWIVWWKFTPEIVQTENTIKNTNNLSRSNGKTAWEAEEKRENGGAPLRKMFAGLAAIRLFFFLWASFEAWLHMQLHFTATKLITNKRAPKVGMGNGEIGGGFSPGIQQIFSVRFHFDCSFPSICLVLLLLSLPFFFFCFLTFCLFCACFLSLHNKSLRKAFQFKWMKNEGKNVLCMSMVGGVFQGKNSKQSVNDALGPSQENWGVEEVKVFHIMFTFSHEKGLRVGSKTCSFEKCCFKVSEKMSKFRKYFKMYRKKWDSLNKRIHFSRQLFLKI